MRYSLLDLLIATVASLPGLLVGMFLGRYLHNAPLALLLTVSLAAVAYLLVTPPIYRQFHWRPVWLPRCPRCHDKDRHYWYEKPKPEWPRDVVKCAICGTALELWYESPRDEQVSTAMPSFRLVWPQSCGRWRPIGR